MSTVSKIVSNFLSNVVRYRFHWGFDIRNCRARTLNWVEGYLTGKGLDQEYIYHYMSNIGISLNDVIESLSEPPKLDFGYYTLRDFIKSNYPISRLRRWDKYDDNSFYLERDMIYSLYEKCIYKALGYSYIDYGFVFPDVCGPDLESWDNLKTYLVYNAFRYYAEEITNE